ncbi:SLA/LP autoantigen-like protein [Novymonas esmeraldas]|uniref:O-phosphoseryl-tRNA(Sec) selenium transferase n=1 Tax=Novymonas esmeraldas TaxID=1808958 RepID=A0AAW0EZQ8_9TRYP
MDDRALQLAEEFVSARYIDAGRESLHSTARALRSILAQRRCLEDGLPDAAIELVLRQLALMDSNNFTHHVGGGEREGRVISAMVRQRHFHFTHGIGRSGDLVSEQPKAAGSSLLYKLTNVMMLDLLRQAGVASTAAAVVVPMATGMTLALVLRSVAASRIAEAAAAAAAQREQQQQSTALSGSGGAEGGHCPAPPPSVTVPRYVIWPRIDQKTALKCIDAAGLVPVPVQLRPAPSPSASAPASSSSSSLFLECRVEDVAAAVDAVGGPAAVVCVLSTTSCFAPRLPDDTVAMARYCKSAGLPYVVNNAYGVQSRRIMTRLDAAQRLGRVDAVVQSGDKNFLVPVGGSIVSSSDKRRCDAVAALYAGRASMSPVTDLFITALSLGRRGMQALWDDRERCRLQLVRQLRVFACERGEELLADDVDVEVGDDGDEAVTEADGGGAGRGRRRRRGGAAALPRNDISVAITMRTYGRGPTSVPANGAGHLDGDRPREAEASGPPQWAAARALGAQLFRRAVSGPRVVTPAATTTTIAGCAFQNYGMHQDGAPPCPLLVLACGIGMTATEVDELVSRLRSLWPIASNAVAEPVR